MTKEELFRAVGEVREDQIEAAENIPKKQARPWRRLGALAACLALVVTAAAAAVPLISEQLRWKAIVYSFNPGGADTGSGGDAGESAGTGSLDGSHYWTDNPNRPTHPDYSTNVEIGELSGPGNEPGMLSSAACLVSLTPEEIFALDTVIFRGTVRELQYFQVEMDALNTESVDVNVYYTRALVEVTDSIRGSLTEGETCALLYTGAKGWLSTSVSGALEDLEVGSEAIFMPIRTTHDTGWREGDSYFCYADLAELYLGEGIRFIFADTGEGLYFDRGTYLEIAGAETLDEAAAYIREMIGEPEGTQPAEVPSTPQTEPSKTRNGGLSAAFSDGPIGARELPGGALIGE